MRYQLVVEPSDIEIVCQQYQAVKEHPIVKARQARNVDSIPPQINKEELWRTLIMCLLTTQNKSGVGSTVDKFLKERSFPLSLELCITAKRLDEIITTILSSLRIRRWKISADFLQNDFRILEEGGWATLELWRDRLFGQRSNKAEPEHYLLEREAAQAVQKLLIGFGPKQSRNFWQDVGLFRYEIPIDSRILRWLNNHLNFYIPSGRLSDERYYSQVMDAVRELALKAGFLPCMLDASIFASYEKK
jgi:thermostable 8-oxoguanine DNA glycosylase